MKEVIIEGEKAYPIYSFKLKWYEDGNDEGNKNLSKDLPAGKIWNATNFKKMFKKEQSDEKLIFFIIEWWNGLVVKEKLSKKNPSIPVIKIKLIDREVWCKEWFQHYTFDIGQTNQEVLNSFQKYVDRQIKALRIQKKDISSLMGAEERWRWHGNEPEGDSTTRSEPPCRCKSCEEQGILRIAH